MTDPPAQPESAKKGNKQALVELSKQGHRLMKSGSFQEACDVFARALSLEPGNPYILTGLADAHRALKDFNGAEDYYRRVLDREPENSFALRGLGDTYRDRGEPERAIILWQRYLRLRSDDIFVLTRVADSCKTLGHFDEAEAGYRKILNIRPDDRYSLMGLADLYHKFGRETQAITFYEKVLEQDSQMVNILTILGNLYRRRNEIEAAQSCYERVLQQDSNNPYALYGMGEICRWQCDYLGAIDRWETILLHHEGTTGMLSRLGDAYRNIGNLEIAEKYYRRVLDNGYDRYALLGMAKLRCRQSRFDDVTDIFMEFIRREGESMRVVDEMQQILNSNQKDMPLPPNLMALLEQCRKAEKMEISPDELPGSPSSLRSGT